MKKLQSNLLLFTMQRDTHADRKYSVAGDYSRPEVLLSRHIFQLFWGKPKAFPGQLGYVIPPVCSGSASGFPLGWTCPEYLHREANSRHPEPDQMTDPAELCYELLTDIKALQHVPKGEASL